MLVCNYRSQPDARGSAFIAVLFFVMLIGLVAGTVGMMLGGDLHQSHRVITRAKARHIADGAAYQALGFVADDPDTLNNPPTAMITGSMGEGTYSVSIQPISGGVSAEAIGTVDDITETVRVYLRAPNYGAALAVGIFANGDIIGHGNGYVESGTHSNQSTEFWGSIEVRGDADSVGTTTLKGAANVTGTARSGVRRVAFPPLDFDYYYEIAKANNQVYTGDMVLKGTYNPPGGVMWVDGNVDTQGTTTINGAIFATGNIEDHGKTTLIKHSDFPALASENGFISFHGKSTFEGLIYTKTGNVYLHGNTGITGAIIAWGDVDSQGNWGQLDYQLQNPKLEDDNTVEFVAWEY
ncbi:MAG: hypothetical protein K9N51_10495 [Candidatus Pacebacteria bacterium]|nr:hypothetical protein [Candidatus Paceibacterota bacterium]